MAKYFFTCRKAVLEAAIRKKIEYEKKALRVVERLLEEDISEEFLVDCVCLPFANFILIRHLNILWSLLILEETEDMVIFFVMHK